MVEQITDNILNEVIVQRPADSFKGDFGHVLLIGGDVQYGGAIIMAAQAAVSSGAGLVTVASDEVNRSALHSRVPEAMFIDWHNLTALIAALDRSDVVLMGPGMGLSDYAVSLVKRVLLELNDQQILVADGSALTIVANEQLSFPHDTFTIITPHQMEWARLSNIQLNYQHEIQMNDVQRQMLNVDVLVLKQHHTILYDNEGQQQLMLGGPYQSVGGMGDVLAGITAAFVAQFQHNLIHTVQAAVYAHSDLAQQMAGYNYVVRPSLLADGMANYMGRVQNNLVD
ncbi:hydroxyethylthiazole kinase-like uncharacterized protein yjeF [Weissella uvarum]|uniref:NAD(P)H-hydrate dehydratase n=1 Tax=Weissella uvarum TaxID=1479233 RepID=UPI0019608074|nr:NAD(P)H-hydrate dehydratase [Weissella uvarum]MBM7617665.1 hydroxyethylthiazole kinase-like uncharacterized protein yjeF [Weissella uvarum]MCM0596014.1 NAD(P)H-hydrate dehydratase [Weissella uvarum]